MKQKLFLLLALIGLVNSIKADEIRFDNYELHLTFMLNQTTKEATVGTGQNDLANAKLYPPLGDPWWNMIPQPNYWNDLNIPETIVYGGETYTVTKIAPYAFHKMIEIMRVSLPETIHTIGSSAFSFCVNMLSINIPSRVTELFPETFMLCRKLRTVELPSSIVRIGSSAFSECDGLESIAIPGNCESIGDDAFCWCNKLHKVIFEGGESTLNLGCGRKISKYLYASVDYINEDGLKEDDLSDHPRGLFADCSLDTIYLARDITYPSEQKWRSIHWGSLPYGAQIPIIHLFPFIKSSQYDVSGNEYHDYHPSLKLLEFGEGITVIPDSLFMVSAIQKLSFSESLKSLRRIGFMAFCNARTGIEELVIPENVESIDSYAFGHWRNNSSLSYAGSTVLSKLTFLSNKLTSIGSCAFDIKNVEELEIPSSVKNLSGAFYNIEKLRYVKCNPIVAPYGGNPFGEAAVYVPSGSGASYRESWTDGHIIDPNDEWVSINVRTAGSLYSRLLAQDIQASNVYRLKLKGTLNDDDITVLNTMNNLYDLDLSGLTMNVLPKDMITNKKLILGLKLPNVLEKINDDEFKDFVILRGTIEIPSLCTSLGKYSFSNTSIESLIYNGAKEFGEGAFSSCKKLRDVNITQGTIVGESCFESNKNMSSVRIGSGAKIGDFAFNASGIEDVVLENGVSSVGSNAFGNGVQKLTFEGSVDIIGNSAFGEPSEISVPDILTWCNLPFPDEGPMTTSTRFLVNNEEKTSITIPDGVRQVRNNLFSNCSQLKGITIPEGVTTIGENAFANCANLETAQMPQTITTLHDGAFMNCPNLRDITLSNSVESIGKYVFQNCISLNNIECPKSLENISTACFNGCTNLKTVKFGKELKKICDNAFSGCTSLSNMDIPVSVSKIEEAAFGGCSSLEKVIVHWDNPFVLNEDVFTDLPSSCYLHIPIMTSNKYLDKGWKNVFPNLKESGIMVVTAKAGGTVTYGTNIISNRTEDFLFNPFKSFYLNIEPDNNFYIKKVKLNNENVTSQVEEGELFIEEPDENLDIYVVFADENISLGDVNGDGVVNVTDAIAIVNHIIKKENSGFLEFASDMNDDDIVNVTDAVMVINHLFPNNAPSRKRSEEVLPQ